jgi:16S rRNA (cytidine1402-2'-O)-methyltransferase
MSTLYVVSTPIGNLEDISPRAIEVLRHVHLILAEDTRRTKHLLQHYQIPTSLLSYYQHSQLKRVDYILELLCEHDLALVSDAGTPGISDPGQKIIERASAHGHRIVPILGSTAFLSALVAAGIPLEEFTFLGFLPRSASHQCTMVQQELRSKRTVIFYESPYRLVKTLTNLKQVVGKRQICIARELTKKFEEFIRGDIGQVLQTIGNRTLKGEVTVLIG